MKKGTIKTIMINPAVKSISVILIFSIFFVALTSCNLLFTQKESDNKDQTNDRDYYAVKTLYSYEDVLDALSIVEEKYDIEPTYTVDGMGNDYTVFYQFITPHEWTEYPIDYEIYFTTKSRGFFCTFIFFENQLCPGHKSSSIECGSYELQAKKLDEDYKKLVKYKSKNACVWIQRVTNNVVEIEDKSLLSWQAVKGLNKYDYCVYYGENKIMDLRSCIKLDEVFFNSFFDSIVITNTEK